MSMHKILVVDDGTETSRLIFCGLKDRLEKEQLNTDLKLFTIDLHSKSGLSAEGNIKEFRGDPIHLAENVDEVTILLVHLAPVSGTIIKKAQDLKCIGSARSSLVNIDTKSADERSIPVIYCPGRNAQSVAEFTIGMMLSLLRRIPAAHNLVTERRWDVDFNRVYFNGLELKGKVLGLVGFGDIGKAVANLALGFGMNVHFFDPYAKVSECDFPITRVTSLENLLEMSDIVSLHAKSQGKPIIGKREILKMKRGSFLINTARGDLIDENELIVALETGHLAGAGLDVFVEEPLSKNSKLIDLSNVLLTPHLAGMTSDMAATGVAMLIEDVMRFIRGETPFRLYKGI